MLASLRDRILRATESSKCSVHLISLQLGFFRRRQREALEKLLQEENDNEWNEFTVTKADVEAEKEFFRKSMMMGAADLKVLQEQIEGSTEDVKDLG